MKLTDVLIDEIKDLYSAETQLIKALPKMARAVSDAKLKAGIMAHWKQTKEHASRLEQAAAMLGAAASGRTCRAMKGLIEEGCEKIDLPEGSARDASLICAAQKVQHYEIAGYGSVRAFALQVGQHKIATLLEMTLDEEAETYHKLTEIAERIDPLAESVEACPIISQRFLTMQCDDIDLQLVGNSILVVSLNESSAIESDERAWTIDEIFQLLGRNPRHYLDVDSLSVK